MKLTCYRSGLSIGLFVMGMLLTNCENCNQSDRPLRLREASFAFTIFDSKTNKNLFLNKFYSIDSVRLINSTNTTLVNFRDNIGEYSFGIGPVYIDSLNQINQRGENTFYLYLNQFDTDTLRLSFLPVQGKCYPFFKNYQVFYNQRLITTGQNVINFSAEIKKL